MSLMSFLERVGVSLTVSELTFLGPRDSPSYLVSGREWRGSEVEVTRHYSHSNLFSFKTTPSPHFDGPETPVNSVVHRTGRIVSVYVRNRRRVYRWTEVHVRVLAFLCKNDRMWM